MSKHLLDIGFNKIQGLTPSLPVLHTAGDKKNLVFSPVLHPVSGTIFCFLKLFHLVVLHK